MRKHVWATSSKSFLAGTSTFSSDANKCNHFVHILPSHWSDSRILLYISSPWMWAYWFLLKWMRNAYLVANSCRNPCWAPISVCKLRMVQNSPQFRQFHSSCLILVSRELNDMHCQWCWSNFNWHFVSLLFPSTMMAHSCVLPIPFRLIPAFQLSYLLLDVTNVILVSKCIHVGQHILFQPVFQGGHTPASNISDLSLARLWSITCQKRQYTGLIIFWLKIEIYIAVKLSSILVGQSLLAVFCK